MNYLKANKYQTLFFFGLLLISSACIKLNIPPPKLSEIKDNNQISSKKKLSIKIRFEGSDSTSKKWIKALSISRLFYRGIENESGSLSLLLTAPLKQYFENMNYQFHTSHSTNVSDRELIIHIEKSILLWIPPVEFIQTMHPRKKGDIHMDFKIKTSFNKIELNNSNSNQADSQANLYISKKLWEYEFKKKEIYHAYPGQERFYLEVLGHQCLQSYIIELESKLNSTTHLYDTKVGK